MGHVLMDLHQGDSNAVCPIKICWLFLEIARESEAPSVTNQAVQSPPRVELNRTYTNCVMDQSMTIGEHFELQEAVLGAGDVGDLSVPQGSRDWGLLKPFLLLRLPGNQTSHQAGDVVSF